MVSRGIGSDDQAAAHSDLGPAEVGDDAPCGPAELDPGGEVQVVDEMAVADVARAPPGRYPCDRERGRHDPRTKCCAERSVDHLRAKERTVERAIAVDVDEPRPGRWRQRDIRPARIPVSTAKLRSPLVAN